MPSTRVQRRVRVRERRASTEQTILDATEGLLADRAFRDLSIEDVMVAAGLTRTAFYRYFPDLESVLMRLLRVIREDLGRAAGRWLGPDTDPIEGLLPAATGLAQVFRDHGRLLLALSDAAAGSPEIEEAWHASIQSFVAPVRERIEGLCEAGLCDLPDPAQTAVALVWMNERYLLETFGRGTGVSLAVAAETVASIWRRTLFAPR